MGFKIRVKTDNPGSASDTFVFPMRSGAVNCTIDWGDTNQEVITTSGNITHQYAAPGEYDVEIISGTWTSPNFNYSGDREKVIEWKEYGTGYGPNWSVAFNGCINMTSSAVGAFGTGITDMSDAFRLCTSLTSLDVSNWDVSGVTTLAKAFDGNSALVTLDVSNWDVSGVTSLNSTFKNCSALTALDVSNWNVSNVASLEETFNYCSSLTVLDLSSWTIGAVSSLARTFQGCSSLAALDLSSWDVSNVNSLVETFNACSSLTTLNVSNWNTINVTSLSGTFFNCSAIETIDVSNWNTSNVTSMSQTFRTCSSLVTLDVSDWDVSKVTSMYRMFRDCTVLRTVDVANWDVSLLASATAMFERAGFNDASYDALLNGWSKLTLQNGLSFHAGTAKYALAAERAVLTDTFGWNISDGGPQDLDYLVDGFLWYAVNDNVYLSDGLTSVNLLNAAPAKVGVAYGSGQMRLTVDGVDSAEVAYDASLLIGTLDIFRGASATRRMRNLRRYDGTYEEAKTKIDELMA